MTYLDRIKACHNVSYAHFIPLYFDQQRIGWLSFDFIQQLFQFNALFKIDLAAQRVSFTDTFINSEWAQRNADIAAMLAVLHEQGVIQGWRDELYAVTATCGFTQPHLFCIERAAVSYFGITAYGVHVNGYVRDDAELSMWIGTRAPTKTVDPSKKDQLVAGGQPHHLSLLDNVVKECAEEAGISVALAKQAQSVGLVHYQHMETQPNSGIMTLRSDILYCYDLSLPKDFMPIAVDGEVAGFELLPITEVMHCLTETSSFKFNCSLVVIDFLIRHGFITPDHTDYFEIIMGLRGMLGAQSPMHCLAGSQYE